MVIPDRGPCRPCLGSVVDVVVGRKRRVKEKVSQTRNETKNPTGRKDWSGDNVVKTENSVWNDENVVRIENVVWRIGNGVWRTENNSFRNQKAVKRKRKIRTLDEIQCDRIQTDNSSHPTSQRLLSPDYWCRKPDRTFARIRTAM